MGAGVPTHLLWAFTDPASPSTAHAMLSSLPDSVIPRDKTSGCALLYEEQGFNTSSLRGWWVESRGKHLASQGRVRPPHPYSPLLWPAPAPPHPAPLQLWKLVPQPRKVNLLEVSCLAARTSQSGAGGTSPTSKDKGLGPGPEGLEGSPCLKACAPETEKGSRREGGREEEVGSGRERDIEVVGGRASCLGDTGHRLEVTFLTAQQALWSMAVSLRPTTWHILTFFPHPALLPFPR